jgi:Cysteine-rich CPCC
MMIGSIARNRAIEAVAEQWLKGQSDSTLLSILSEWWDIDQDSTDFQSLSMATRSRILNEGAPDIVSEQLKDLLLVAARLVVADYSNGYLSSAVEPSVLADVGTDLGEEPDLQPCAVCAALTIVRRGEYDICPVCGWEDDGLTDGIRHSSVNRMSITEGRLNFCKWGAVDKKLRGSREPIERYRVAPGRLCEEGAS